MKTAVVLFEWFLLILVLLFRECKWQPQVISNVVKDPAGNPAVGVPVKIRYDSSYGFRTDNSEVMRT